MELPSDNLVADDVTVGVPACEVRKGTAATLVVHPAPTAPGAQATLLAVKNPRVYFELKICTDVMSQLVQWG